AHGVPHIEAANENDLFMAQGYVTAQDRLWQMDALRRNANGELAEVMGASQVEHDRAQRVQQFRNTAQRVYANLPPADRARFEAYARGVNLYIAQHGDALPPEFRLLGYRPKPWSGVDSISIGVMMAQMLDTHWDSKLMREYVAAKLDHLNNPKLEQDLYPVGSWRDHPPTGVRVDLTQPQPAPPPADDDEDEDDRSTAVVQPEEQDRLGVVVSHPSRKNKDAARVGHPRLMIQKKLGAPGPDSGTWESANSNRQPTETAQEDPQALRVALGLPTCASCAPGSNNWVIAGAHTASGMPLLANDMHLGLTEPNIWYTADLKAKGNNGAPGYHAAGVTLPGMPYIVAGHNEHVAWGFTALYADVQDLYLEALDGKGNFQALDGSWKPLAVDHEVIKVRGGKDVVVDVQFTDHGPLLNPIFVHEKRPISLKWTLYDPALSGLQLYQLNVASNWTEFSAALEQWSWPTLNVVYSDDQGHIGYHAIGKVPERAGGFVLFRTPMFHDTLNLRGEWFRLERSDEKTAQGQPMSVFDTRNPYIPFDQMPNAFDPPSGFLATANSRVTINKKQDSLFLGDESAIPLTLEWAEPYRAERIYKLLDGRDHLTAADMLAVQTDIYSEADQELGHRIAYAIDHTPSADERLKKAADLMRSWDGKLTTDSAAASVVTKARYAFWPLILKPKLGDDFKYYQWSESNFAEEEIIMHASADWLPPGYKNWDELLTDAVRQGMKDGKAPSDVSRWSYGSWHVVDIEHPIARFLPLIGRIAGTGAQPLSGDTLTVKQVGREFGPSQRFTMDWSNVDGSTENIVLGESGNPYSPYFRDQWNNYYGGTTFALPFTTEAVATQTRHTLRLLP
ncbi:MAG: penicillin acylase family protein, partial [Terracidiphilus sp.]